MAKFNYSEWEQSSPTTKTENNFKKVGYFNALKNDGDEVVVRFPYASTEEFDLVNIHKVKVGTYYRNVSCLRGSKEPLDLCPLCVSGNDPRKSLFFVKMIIYQTGESGLIEAVPCVWERPISFAKQLATYISEYGDLKNYVFKIKRQGARGDLKTTYSIIPTNRDFYTAETGYVLDFSAFDTLDLSKHSYMNKTLDDINYYISTGAFPEIVKESIPQQNISYGNAQVQAPTTTRQPMYGQNLNGTPSQNYVQYNQPQPAQPVGVGQPATYTQPSSQVNQAPTQPRRTYTY